MKCQGKIPVRPCVWVEQKPSELPDTPILHLPAWVVLIIFNAK